MKKSLKPFAVELRRTGKKIASLPAKHLPDIKTKLDAPAPREPVSAPVLWPEIKDTHVSEARRVADAMFKTTRVDEPILVTQEASESAETRRVLPSLDEPDYIARLLQEEEARRPKRGRKPGAGLAPVRRVVVKEEAYQPEPVAPLMILKALPKTIKGYVRGRIYARYVRKTEPGFGQYWRKRPTPAW